MMGKFVVDISNLELNQEESATVSLVRGIAAGFVEVMLTYPKHTLRSSVPSFIEPSL